MRREDGLTIIELLVVMGIIAVIAGLSVGMLKRGNQSLTVEANAKLVRANLRLARNTARASGAGAFVALDRENGRVEAYPVSAGGNWHFEDDAGSRATRIRSDGSFVEGGRLGRCLSLDGGIADLGGYAYYQPVNGFVFGVWIKIDEYDAATVFERENCFRLSMTAEGGLIGEVHVGSQHEVVATETREAVVPLGVWAHVSLSYDRVELAVDVDGVRFAKRPERRTVSIDLQAHVSIGGKPSTLKGLYDEARYDVVGEGSVEELAPGGDVVEGSDLLIRFDGKGRLDSRYHAKPATIRMLGEQSDDESGTEADEVVVIRVEMSGVIR